MIKKLLFVLLFSLCGPNITPSRAQSIYFIFSNGTNQIFQLSEIRSITYNLDTMNINKNDGTVIPLVIDTISNFSYNGFASISLETFKTGNDLIIYPNPSKDFFNFEYESQRRGNITIEIFKNSNGELVKQFTEFKELGKCKLNFNLPIGIYILKIHEEDKTIVKKIIILN